MPARLRSLLRNLLRRAEVERRTEEELRSFLELAGEELERQGLSPGQARRMAAARLGSLEATKESIREARAGAGIETVAREALLALRQLRRAPGFSLSVVLTLALAIGANTAVFSVVRAVLLEPLPYRDPERLLIIWSNLDRAGYMRGPLSGPELLDLRREASLLDGIASIWATTAQLSGDSDPEQVRIGQVTANFFAVLGIDLRQGRAFLEREEGAGAAPVVILSEGLWRRRFGADPGMVGKAIRMDGTAVTVVGIAPAELRLWFPRDASVPTDLQAFVPFPTELASDPRPLYYLRTLARLAPGAPLEAARSQVAELGRRLEARHTDYAASGRSLFAEPLHADATREVRPALLALAGAVGMVLLLACLNVANLMLGRDLARQGQLALRAALGASRWQLVRQALIETLLLASLGVLLGVGVAAASLRALLALRPPGLSRFDSVGLDLPVLLFAVVAGLLGAVVVALVGLAGAFRVNLADALRRIGRGGDASRRRVRRLVVASEVALGTVLLVGAGLLVRSVLELQRVEPGFHPEGVLTLRLSLPQARYPDREAVAAFARRLEERLRALPGVEAVGSMSALPYDSQPNWSTPYLHDGLAQDARGAREADARAVGPGFLGAAGAQLLAGREFTEADDARSAPVVIVDDLLARRAWPGKEAVGQRLQVEFLNARTGEFEPTWARVVGVIRHVRHRSLSDVVREQVYVPQRQSPRQPWAYLLRAGGDPASLAASVRHEVAALDPELPVYDVRLLTAYLGEAIAPARFTMRLATAFAALALGVAAIGVYGVVSYSVLRRRREIAVRMALGAEAGAVLRGILGEGLSLTAIGLCIGVGGAAAASGLARSVLYGVGPFDPRTYGLVGLLLAATALAASIVPGLRASRISPIQLLNSE
jgi:putative ABC transport system permease protein